MNQPSRRSLLTVLLLAILCGSGCATLSETFASEAQSDSDRAMNAAQPDDIPGDPRRGADLILNYGCGACHTIPGIPGANTLVGPPLTEFANRRTLAGSLVNTPEHAAQWIQQPHAIEPNTTMPDMGVTPADAVDIVAYLYTLE